jgi:C1A family cysteine protease
LVLNWGNSTFGSPVDGLSKVGVIKVGVVLWSFSTTGALEGAHFMATNNLVSLSEQQFVDCDKVDQGCNGGLMDNGFTYAEKNPLMLESAYAYVSGTTQAAGTCRYDSSKAYGKVLSFHDVEDDNGLGAQLKAALAIGPVSIAIEADDSVFQSYTSGIITSGCGNKLDHGVLAVGYGTDAGQDYFIVKNSWTANWGDNGYVKIAPNQCGIT